MAGHQADMAQPQASPQVSRKIRACEACRKMKMKCIYDEGEDVCSRCQARGLQCKLPKSLQSILVEGDSFRAATAARLDALHAAMKRLATRAGIPSDEIEELLALESPPTSPAGNPSVEPASPRPGKRRRTAAAADASPAPTSSSSPHPNGASVLPLRAHRQMETDLISRGVISLELANSLGLFYLGRMDVHLNDIVEDAHRAMLVTDMIKSIRRSSSLLLLSILAVAALHRSETSGQEEEAPSRSSDPPPHALFPLLYREFVRLASTQAFSREQTLDDIRALVIGATWLPDVSWILVGTAVRISTERGMHESYRHFVRANKGRPIASSPSPRTADDRRAYLEAKLYYLIYITDHVSSIPQGRPPMTRQHAVVRRAADWFEGCPLISPRDAHLVAQVKLWEILHDVIDLLGSDVHTPLDLRSIALRNRFAGRLENWLKTWGPRCCDENTAEPVDASACQVLYHSAAFFLDSAAFRSEPGKRPRFFESPTASTELGADTFAADVDGIAHGAEQDSSEDLAVEQRRRVAESAISHAHGMLRHVVAGPEYPGLEALPFWLLTMTVFAIVFLIKTNSNFGGGGEGALAGSSSEEILRSIGPALQRLSLAERQVAQDHVLRRVVSDLRAALNAGGSSERETASALNALSGAATTTGTATRGSSARLAAYNNSSSTWSRGPAASRRSNGGGSATSTSSALPAATAAPAFTFSPGLPTNTAPQQSPMSYLNQFDLLTAPRPVSGLEAWPDAFGGAAEAFNAGESEGALDALLQRYLDG